MSENTIESTNLPPSPLLDEDLSGVDTSMPVIKGGITTEVEVVSVKPVENKDKTGQNLEIKVKTTTELISTKGEAISPGFPLTTWISLVPKTGRTDGKKEYTENDIRKAQAQFLESVEGKKTSMNPLERFTGMRAMVKVTTRAGTAEYPNESNNITFIKKA